jgi:hypothetical protein
MTLAGFALVVVAQAGAEVAPPWVEEPPSELAPPEVAPPAPPPVKWDSDAPREPALVPEGALPEQPAQPVTLSDGQRFGRFAGGTGLALLFGTFGGGGYMAAPFGVASLGLFGSTGFFSSSGFDIVGAIPAGGSLVPLFMAVAPLSLYPRATGRHVGMGLLGSFIAVLTGGAAFTFLGFAGGGYFALTMLALLTPLTTVLAAMGAGLGYELTPEDETLPRRTRTLSLWSGAVTSMALGFGIAGPVGLIGSALMAGCPSCSAGERSVPVLTSLAIAPLAFGLGPVLTYERKSLSAYFAGVGASVVATAAMTLVWSGIDRLVTWVGDVGLSIGMAFVRLLTAMVPGLTAALFYDLALGPEMDDPPSAEPRALGWDVFPSLGFDGKRGMVGVTVTLP